MKKNVLSDAKTALQAYKKFLVVTPDRFRRMRERAISDAEAALMRGDIAWVIHHMWTAGYSQGAGDVSQGAAAHTRPAIRDYMDDLHIVMRALAAKSENPKLSLAAISGGRTGGAAHKKLIRAIERVELADPDYVKPLTGDRRKRR